jgi:hypothetical protein
LIRRLVRIRSVRRRAGFPTATFVVLASLLALPVRGASVDITRNVTIDDTNLLANTSGLCGFDVYLHQYGSISFKIQERENGIVTIQETAVRVAGTYFAPSTGRSVDIRVNDAGTNIETIYPDGRDVVMNAGTDGVITVPGYGHVYIGVGRVLIRVAANGDVSEVTVGARDPDHSGVCPLLA